MRRHAVDAVLVAAGQVARFLGLGQGGCKLVARVEHLGHRCKVFASFDELLAQDGDFALKVRDAACGFVGFLRGLRRLDFGVHELHGRDLLGLALELGWLGHWRRNSRCLLVSGQASNGRRLRQSHRPAFHRVPHFAAATSLDSLCLLDRGRVDACDLRQFSRAF